MDLWARITLVPLPSTEEQHESFRWELGQWIGVFALVPYVRCTISKGCGTPLVLAKGGGEASGTCKAEAVPSATVGCSHRLSLLTSLTIEFSAIERRNTWWAWQVTHHHSTGMAGTQCI